MRHRRELTDCGDHYCGGWLPNEGGPSAATDGEERRENGLNH